jgi:hypothetical protein
VEVVVSFFQRLYSFQQRQGEEDRIGWSPSKKSKFEVKSFDQVLTSQNGSSFPWKSIWRVKTPSRVAFFCVDSSIRENIGAQEFEKDECCGG